MRYFSATSSRASWGHSENQLMVVQFTKAGYWRIQFLGKGFERHSSPFVEAGSLHSWPPHRSIHFPGT